MRFASTRTFARYVHIFIALLQAVYIYSPLHSWPEIHMLVRYVTFPLLVLSGVWLALGPKIWFPLRKILFKRDDISVTGAPNL